MKNKEKQEQEIENILIKKEINQIHENNKINIEYFYKTYKKYLDQNFNIDIEFLIDQLKEIINKNNIRIYNIEIYQDIIIIRLNNLLLNENNKINELNKLCNELILNNYNVKNYKINYLYIIEIELNY